MRLPASGPLLKPGMTHPDIALLRQRLKVPAEAGRETFYDPALQEAVAAFQRENKMGPDGVVGTRTRSVLNGNEPPKPALSGSETQRLIANMERWRWLPEELGAFHVWDNIPEFTARVLKNGQVIHTAKIVVGKVENQTPLFSENMRYVVFQPEWGVPDGIKLKEIAPYLRSGGGGFFGFFGADTSVLQRHNLQGQPERPAGRSELGQLGPGRHPPVQLHPAGRTHQRAGRREIPVPQQARRLHARHLAARAVQAERARVQPWLHAGGQPRPPGRAAARGGQGLAGRPGAAPARGQRQQQRGRADPPDPRARHLLHGGGGR